MKTKHLFLPFLLLIALLLRLPSLFEPYWYGDEGIYQTIGLAMAKGRPLYESIWDNKPPLLYMIYALFSGDQFWVRLASLVVMLFTIVVFHRFSRRLFVNIQTVNTVTVLFAILFAMPFLEGNIANSENFMVFPIILSLYLVVSNKQFFLAGFLLGIAFLLKIVAVFDLGAALCFLFVVWVLKDKKEWFIKSFVLSLGFTSPVALTFLYFFLNGSLSDFITAVFSQNVTYVGAGNKLFIGQGLLLLKLLLLGTFCLAIFAFSQTPHEGKVKTNLFIFLKRKTLRQEYIFIYLWFAFSIFNAFFGGRPWTHYLLTLLPAFCLFLGIMIENARLRFINIVLCAILLLLIAKNFWIYGKTVGYYINFIGFTSGVRTAQEYLNFFDWYVTRDYEIAAYIRQRSKETDTLYIWGDNAQIYALSKRLPVGRYTVAYHVTFYPNALLDTKEAIKREKPPFIVVIRDDFPSMLLDANYSLKREVKGVKIFERGI